MFYTLKINVLPKQKILNPLFILTILIKIDQIYKLFSEKNSFLFRFCPKTLT